MKYHYDWRLADEKFTATKGKVFSCFAGCGGSSMGMKRSGYEVIGCNEVDAKMMACYVANLKPKFSFLEGIQTFKNREDLPEDLFNLDILEGSPPCSSYSLSGVRDRDWGKEKVFKEGQHKQVLDTLFYDFIDLAKRLQPKSIIAENVMGLMLGKAKKYVREIYRQYDLAGYTCEHFLLNSSVMGVPQRRERVFFIGMRKDLAEPFLKQKDLFTVVPELKLDFNEKEIPFGEIELQDVERRPCSKRITERWALADNYGMYDQRANGGVKFGYFHKLMRWRVCATITASGAFAIEPTAHYVTDKEFMLCGSFPQDYDFKKVRVQYAVGMSVPPNVMAHIGDAIYDQWLSKIK